MTILNPHRLALLFKLELALHRKLLNILAIASSAVFLLLTTLSSAAVSAGCYALMLWIGGIALTNTVFQELNDPHKANRYLTLPCTAIERLLSTWLFTAIAYPCGLFILYALCISVKALLVLLIFQQSLRTVEAFTPHLLTVVQYYLPLQAFVWLGALHFRRHALLKTFFSGLLLSAVIALVATLIAAVLPFAGVPPTFYRLWLALLMGPAAWSWWVLTPFFAYLAYLKLSTLQVSG